MNQNLFNDLKHQVLEIRDNNGHLTLDNAFIVWFLRAFVTDDEKDAINSIFGGPKDKSVDAIYIDNKSHNVFIIQGKYRQSSSSHEKRSDIIALADLGRCILNESDISFKAVLKGANNL